MRNFLYGVVLGLVVASGLFKVVDAYDQMNRRVSFIEGYISQLDRMIRHQ